MKCLGKFLCLASIVLPWPRVLSAQHIPPSTEEVTRFAQKARTEMRAGDPVRVPKRVLREISSEAPTDFPPCGAQERSNVEAHKVPFKSKSIRALAIRGKGFCYCGATGNCAFWIYRYRSGKYELILATDMVQTFGFLRSRTHGYPDLVTWSHGSATDRSAQLFRFDGNQYVDSGGWEEEYEYLDEDGQTVTPDKPRITSHFWGKDAIP